MSHINDTEITDALVAEHGLTEDEYQMVCDHMGRTPNYTELGVFSVMWSEHCSYKSSRKWLKKLPVDGAQVIQGPGENAGVIDIGDGDAAVFKMESHNHPSFIEPYQGAATGVGGIMRDVFTMGARPVANLNALRFGQPDHAKTRHLVAGVVSGIGGYGNCIGVPTVGGEINFDKSYNGNILVNAMCVGVARTDKIFYAAATGIGAPVVYVGSKPAATASTARPWHRQNLTMRQKKNAQPFKSAIRLPKNCCSKRVRSLWPLMRLSGFRIWAQPVLPHHRSKWPIRVVSVFCSTLIRCRAARNK